MGGEMTYKIYCLIGLFLFLGGFVYGQPELHHLNSQHDTSIIDRQLYKLKTGDSVKIQNATYKIIEDTLKYKFRVSYIYLDGSRMPAPVIDSIRSLILKRYRTGESFEKLADEYNMDPNPRHGDTGFFEAGVMVKEFEDTVRRHVAGDIFIVDIPVNQWYYVVKKTFADQVITEMTVLEIK